MPPEDKTGVESSGNKSQQFKPIPFQFITQVKLITITDLTSKQNKTKKICPQLVVSTMASQQEYLGFTLFKSTSWPRVCVGTPA